MSARGEATSGRGAQIVVNGEPRALSGASTVALLLDRLEIGADARGVAVAVDGEVVPRGQWQARTLAAGARVEVVRAVQGG